MKKEYYANGKLKSKIEYRDTIKSGNAIFYYENGSPYKELFYKNNIQDSVFKEYYSDGILRKKGMYSFGTLMGSIYKYYPNGKLRCYNAIDYNNEIFYSIIFDSFDHKTYEEGLNLAPIVVNFVKKKTYTIKDTVHLVWGVAEPVGYNNQIQIAIRKKMDSVYSITEPFVNYTVRRSIIDYQKTFKQPGQYQIVIGSKLVQLNTSYSATDTSIVDIVVQ